MAASPRPPPISPRSGARSTAGASCRPSSSTEMTRPRSEWPEEDRRYGLGIHLHRTSDAVWLEGYDAGVSVCTTHDPASGITHSVIANWSDGAWPMLSVLDEHLGTA